MESGLFPAPGTNTVTTPAYAPWGSDVPLVATVTVLPAALAVSHPLPFKVVALTPMVTPVITPPICTIWLGGAAAPTVCVNTRPVAGVAVALDATTVRTTLMVCAGTLGAVLETVIVPG